MIVEGRDYRIKAGRLMQFVAIYEEHGLHLQKEHLGRQCHGDGRRPW